MGLARPQLKWLTSEWHDILKANRGDRAIIGRPSKFEPRYAKQAKLFCERGATDQELAELFDVEVRTIYRWKHEHQAFCQALMVGKADADTRVERSLYQRAVGYEREATKVFMPTGASEPIYATFKDHVPADISAVKLWLTNRRGDLWRDSSRVEHTGADGGPIELQARQAAISEMLADFRLAKRSGDLTMEHKPSDGNDLL